METFDEVAGGLSSELRPKLLGFPNLYVKTSPSWLRKSSESAHALALQVKSPFPEIPKCPN